jgi:uncharacterized protein YaaR (DUF327 family)
MACEDCDKDITKLKDQVLDFNRELGGIQVRVSSIETVSQSVNTIAKDVGAIQQQITHLETSRQEDRETNKRMFDLFDKLDEKMDSLKESFLKKDSELDTKIGKITWSATLKLAGIITLILGLMELAE